MAPSFSIATKEFHAPKNSNFPTQMPVQDAIVSVEANFLPSHENDAMFDGIVEYLRSRRYPSFIKLTTDKISARAEFRRKCGMFFLDKNGDLLHGRAAGVHRHVLRRGELSTVFHFVHEALGHCCALVCIRVVSPSLWSCENMELLAQDEIKRCGCRPLGSSWRSACNLETSRYILLKFARDVSGGFAITLRSTSKDVDFRHFQSTVDREIVQRKVKKKKSMPPILIDGRYRIYDDAEMVDVLEKLHVAFAHCAANNLRILFKSRFYCFGFCNAAAEVCSRCWLCMTEGRKKRKLTIKCYEYDVIVQGDINDPSRKFLIKPRGISPEEAEQFMASVLGSCNNIITLEEAAIMADTSNEISPSTKKQKLTENMNRELLKKKQQQFARGESNPTTCADMGKKRRRKSGVSSNTGAKAKKNWRLIPPSEISLGPTSSNDWSDTDSSACGSSQNTGGYTDFYCADQHGHIEDSHTSAGIQNHATPLSRGSCLSHQHDTRRTTDARWSEGVRQVRQDSDSCNQFVANDDTSFSEGEQVQAAQDPFSEDFTDLQPTESQYLTFLMDYNADFDCDAYAEAPVTTDNSFQNGDCVEYTDPLEDLRDLSLDVFADLINSTDSVTSVEPWYDLNETFGPF
ncbi:hypothetical protein GCK32_001004 [Trichostrongylus colubriformis]|uniref:Uncharacterized protein n=1 Tax=Trichostrongylus colubriformis TaxID=6319 RepID=A0AAN8J3D9_TRICO